MQGESRRPPIAFITDPPVVHRILSHVGLPNEPPVITPARTQAFKENSVAITSFSMALNKVTGELMRARGRLSGAEQDRKGGAL